MNGARGISSRSSRIVATHAAIAGLCPLIPLPFVDDMVIRRVMRTMFRALYDAHGLDLSRAGARILGAAPPGRLRGAAASLAFFPLRKIFRKAVYVLAIKDCADVASAVFHDGWLLAYYLEDPEVSERPGLSPDDPRALRRVRQAMLRTYADVDPAPLRRALTGSLLGARVGAGHGLQALQRLLRKRETDAPRADEVDDLTVRMRDAAMGEWRYMHLLELRFRRYLGLPALVDEAAGAAP